MERIGPYQVVGEVARGGMGVVYRGQDPALDRPVALKLLLAGRQASAPQRQRFLREAEALARLSHDHVVTVYQQGEHQGAPWLAMEWIEGEELHQRLRRDGPLPLPQVVGLGRALAGALAHAHAQGVLHRDLKPQNVLLRRDGSPVLTDFGLTRLLDSDQERSRLSRTGEFLGSPGYWSPEQARGETDRIGPASDVYGLGAVLYTALTGQPPYGEPTTITEALLCFERAPAPPSQRRSEVPAALDALVLRCLAVDPSERPTPAALERELAALVGGPAAAPARSSRGGAAAAAAILLLGGGLATTLVLLDTNRPGPRAAITDPAASGTLTATASPTAAASSGAIAREETDAFVALAVQRYQAGDREGARAALDRALALDPDHPLALANRGVLETESGQLEAALADYTRALEQLPERGDIWANRAEVRRLRGDVAGGVEDLTRSLELMPDVPRTWWRRGRERFLLGDAAGALADYERALALQPEMVEGWEDRARARYQVGDLAGAEADAERVIELQPERAAGWAIRSAARRTRGDLAGAVADADRAIQLDPSFPDGWSNRGAARGLQGDPEGALADASRAIELDPRHAMSWSNRGLAKRALGDLPGAIEDFSRASELWPTHAVPLVNRGPARREQGDLRGALQDLDRAVELDPGLAAAWFQRGLTREEAGDAPGAAEDYRAALRLGLDEGQAAAARARLARLEAGR